MKQLSKQTTIYNTIIQITTKCNAILHHISKSGKADENQMMVTF